MSKVTDKQSAMIEALSKNYSNVTKCCEIVGINRSTHYEWLQQNPTYKKACDDIQEALLDRAETILMDRLEESDTALIFFLKTRGKKRGYIEKQEIENMGEININITRGTVNGN